MVWHTIFHHVFMFTSIKNAGNRGGWMFFVPLFRSFCVGPALSLETIHNHTFSFFYLWPPTKNLSLPRNETGTCNYRLRERKNKKKTNQKMSKTYNTIFFSLYTYTNNVSQKPPTTANELTCKLSDGELTLNDAGFLVS